MALLVEEETVRKLLAKFDSDRHYSVSFNECVEEFIEECKKVVDNPNTS